MILLKLRKLNWVFSKNWIYYAVYNNTKYYLIAHIFLANQKIADLVKKIQQNLMKCIKIQNGSETKLINWDSSRPINESICLKD